MASIPKARGYSLLHQKRTWARMISRSFAKDFHVHGTPLRLFF
jgi:hypothetical protein